MSPLAPRPWLSAAAEERVQDIVESMQGRDAGELVDQIDAMIEMNGITHERDGLNLNPATNVMNPRAEEILGSGIGSRPSLGHPGEKYEMGLTWLEDIEVTAQALAAETFRADFAEIRVGSGAMANLYVFMACAQAGDAVIVPPASIGGHVTHHQAGAAGLYGLDIHEAPIDVENHTVDVDGVADLARRVQPKVITIGTSLNLFPHPIEALREIADEVGATLMFDAAHLSGPIAGGSWPDPLARGAHVMTMSTYKSLGGPPSGLLVTNDATIAERVDAIAYPGLTANFDVASSASLAIALLDWRDFGSTYAKRMHDTAAALAHELIELGVPVHRTERGVTESHAFAIDASALEGNTAGGHELALRLEACGLLASAIGLPKDIGTANASGLRIGTNELVRWGYQKRHMAALASLIAEGITSENPKLVMSRVATFRRGHRDVHLVHDHRPRDRYHDHRVAGSRSAGRRRR